MTTRLTLNLVVLVAAVGMCLAGCASTSPTPAASANSPVASATTPTPAAAGGSAGGSSTAGVLLKIASTSLGQVVVDGNGMTIYQYDKDTQNSGKSTCTGQCAAAWPAVETDSATPNVQGVTGKVGTIAGVDGKKQVTLDGWPLYLYAPDKNPGDTSGQGVGGVWWVLSPAGARMTAAAGTGGGGY